MVALCYDCRVVLLGWVYSKEKRIGVVKTALLIFLFFPLMIGAMKDSAEKVQIYNAKTGKTELVETVVKSDEEWKKILMPEQYQVVRKKGTERPFSKQCAIPKSGKGVYQCVACGTDLFAYGKKFESGTGWPSFFDPVSDLNIKLKHDFSFGMERTEVLCARCGAHLGHVFDDGPPPTGKRYCINTVTLKLSES